MHIGAVLRDVLIIVVLTAIGGFIVGFTLALTNGGPPQDQQKFLMLIGLSNIIMGALGFLISGVLAPPGRWQHLACVGLGVWLVSLINVAFFGVTIGQWAVGIIAIGIMMGLGGGLSYLFKRESTPQV